MGNIMSYETQPEFWLRGPVGHIPALLQPVAHGLLQVRAEVNSLMVNFPEHRLWVRIAGLAAPGFHLQHIPGVIDRLFTYARGEQLSENQMTRLKEEGQNETVSLQDLLSGLNAQVERALDQLTDTDPGTLTAIRYVGRKRVPATVIGLLAHAAEHSMRHTGQLLVTIRVV
jgi:hypothetical protein